MKPELVNLMRRALAYVAREVGGEIGDDIANMDPRVVLSGAIAFGESDRCPTCRAEVTMRCKFADCPQPLPRPGMRVGVGEEGLE